MPIAHVNNMQVQQEMRPITFPNTIILDLREIYNLKRFNLPQSDEIIFDKLFILLMLTNLRSFADS